MSVIRMPTVAFVYNRRHEANAKTPAVVEIRVTYQWKVKYMSTGIRLLPKEWNSKTSQVTNRFDSIELNKTLEILRKDVLNVIYEMMEEKCIDIFAIPDRIKKKMKVKRTFLDYYAEKAVIRKHGIGKISQGRYDLVARVLKEYGKIVKFSDLTEKNIIDFDNYLKKNGVQATSRWHNYHKFLKRFIGEAIKEGFLKRDPYDGVRLDHGNYDKSIEKFLTVEELKQIREAKMPNERLERVRDLFIFQCYTCLSYKDLERFDMNLITVENGIKIYYDHRKKTSVRLCFPLLGPALEVLERYNGLPRSLTKKGKTSGKIISNQNYNEYLKEISEPAGLKHSLTTHWARHTGATMLLNAGVAPEVIAVIGGWKDTKVLMKIYAKMQEKTVIKAVSDIEDKIV